MRPANLDGCGALGAVLDEVARTHRVDPDALLFRHAWVDAERFTRLQNAGAVAAVLSLARPSRHRLGGELARFLSG